MTDTSWIKPGAAAVYVPMQTPCRIWGGIDVYPGLVEIRFSEGYAMAEYSELCRPTPAEEAEIDRLIPKPKETTP